MHTYSKETYYKGASCPFKAGAGMFYKEDTQSRVTSLHAVPPVCGKSPAGIILDFLGRYIGIEVARLDISPSRV